MKRSDSLLWVILILLVGFVFWVIYTGKLEAVSGSFIDGIWNALENLVRPIFRR